jgi:lysophospholipase L1-like esterase
MVGLVLGESAVRIFVDGRYHMWPPGLRRVFTPLPTVMPGITGPSQYVINQDGMRGDPLPHDDTYKILAIGGSTTECVYLDETEAWPYLLQQSLAKKYKVWVGNAGRSGLNTQSHIVQLTHLTQQYGGIDAVIMLIGVNDFMQRLAKGVKYQPFLGIDTLSPSDYEILMSQTFFTWPGADNREPFFKRLALYRVARELQYRYLTLTPKRLMQDIDGSVYDVWRVNRRQASSITLHLPDLSSALEEYRRNIKTLAKIAAQRSLRLVLATQPYLWRADLSEREQALLWLGGVGRYQEEPGHEYYAIDALADGMGRYNRMLLELCSTEGLECIDLEKEMPKNTTMFFDDVHFTEAGARHVAQVISQYLVARMPFRRTT